MEEYLHTRSKLPLLPGMPEECANMDDLYVELELLLEQKKPSETTSRKLQSQNDLFNLKDERGNLSNRILVRGGPGSGKSSTISKLAYEWANNKTQSTFQQYQLVFALDLREIQTGMNLIDAIHDQLLPKISKEELMAYIEAHSRSVAFFLDGFDEAANALQKSDIKYLLSKKWLQESLVVVTTRPHKVANFVSAYGMYSHVRLCEFSEDQIRKYVAMFFQVQSHFHYLDSKYANESNSYIQELMARSGMPLEVQHKVLKLVAFLKKILSQSLKGLSQVPITLSMLCLLWNENEDLQSETITEIYDAALLHLAKHRQVKLENEEVDVDALKNHLDKTVLQMGELAINALLEDRLTFLASEFDPRVLEEVSHLGLLSKERVRSKLNPVQQVTFIHKTYQEYCAAIYLSHILANDKDMFFSYLNKIQAENVKDMQTAHQFCCATNREAAKIILEYVVRLSCDMIRRDTKTDWDYADTVTEDESMGHTIGFALCNKIPTFTHVSPTPVQLAVIASVFKDQNCLIRKSRKNYYS